MTEWKDTKSVFECCKEYNPNRMVERVVGTELEPSKRIEGNLYKLVDTIFYTTTDTLPLWAGFKERGFKLYTRAIGTYSNDFKLLYREDTIAEYNCPPSKDALVYRILNYDLEFALFIILGYTVRAMIATRDAWEARKARDAWETRKARDAWEFARKARDAAWEAWTVVRDARDDAWEFARKARDAAWDARNAAWDARRAWDVARKARNAWYTREAARRAAWEARNAAWEAWTVAREAARETFRTAFKQTVKSIKTILRNRK